MGGAQALIAGRTICWHQWGGAACRCLSLEKPGQSEGTLASVPAPLPPGTLFAFGSGSTAVTVGTEPNFLTLVDIRAKWPGGG